MTEQQSLIIYPVYPVDSCFTQIFE